jgi:phenylpyruvate tautomerase PptA (4-oxalocrotonate tautomerase family)
MDAHGKPSPTPTRLRQIALVARNIDQAKQQLVGMVSTLCLLITHCDKQTHVIGTPVIFEDPAVAQWGLKNFLGIFPPSIMRIADIELSSTRR